jgi:hypothetical protein
MNMFSNKLKLVFLLLTVVMLTACAGRHQSGQPVSGGDTWKKDQPAQADRKTIAALQNELAALNGRLNDGEARQVAQTAILYSSFLAEEYDLVRPAVFHNVLVRTGFKNRGLCHHWTEDLMKQLERLELKTYQLYWGVAHRGSELREHNSVVVAAKGQNFEKGIVLDPWRHSGELYWIRVKDDRYPWKERPRNEW